MQCAEDVDTDVVGACVEVSDQPGPDLFVGSPRHHCINEAVTASP